MKELFNKLKRRCHMTADAFHNDLAFSSRLAWYRAIDDLCYRVGFHSLSNHFHKEKEQVILQYLQKTIAIALENHKQNTNYGQKTNNPPIWVFWWTGRDNAPKLVQKCVDSIYRNAGDHPVHFLSEENYSQYLDVPAFIMEKMKSGKMGLAHFADYLRVCLLNQYGGLWLDATIFCSDKIPEQFFDTPFFTCKSNYQESRYLSHFEWVTFVLGGWPGNVFYAFLKDAFEQYWKKNDAAIDYLFFDDLIYLAREGIPAIKKIMDDLPTNTPHRDDLQAAFNAKLPAEQFTEIIQKDTPIYKLSWRETYSTEAMDGGKSIYAFFLEMEM